MARSAAEVKFSRMLGELGERTIAFAMLKDMGVNAPESLNDRRANYPFADFIGWMSGGLVAVAVRTRVNWQKPRPGRNPLLNGSFNGAGEPEVYKARAQLRQDFSVADGDILFLWLAIAVDLDDTYEAYWGTREEMSGIGGSETRLRIPMKLRNRNSYAALGRRIAWRADCVVPWHEHPGNWTFQARKRWEELAHIPNRDDRILQAIRDSNSTEARTSTANCAEAIRSTTFSHVPIHSATKFVTEPSEFLNPTRRKMAALLRESHPVPICIAVLDALVQTDSWTDMRALRGLMSLRSNTQGRPWSHKSYSDPANALEDNRFLESRREGRSVLRRVTAAGRAFHYQKASGVLSSGKANACQVEPQCCQRSDEYALFDRKPETESTCAYLAREDSQSNS